MVTADQALAAATSALATVIAKKPSGEQGADPMAEAQIDALEATVTLLARDARKDA